jgi:transcriptional regulator with XRE-family HTH domain
MIKNDGKSLLNTKDTKADKIYCISSNYFGKALKELRLEKGFSQKEAATTAEITQAQWSGYESGKSKPTLDMIILMAQVLGCSPFVLVNKTLDKSKYFSAAYELTFEDLDEIEDTVEDLRRKRVKDKLEAITV